MDNYIVNGVNFELLAGPAVVNDVFLGNVYKFENVPERGIVVDIGANIGSFSLRCAVEKRCKVYSYEPSINTFEVLKRNIKNNNVEDKIIPFNLALSDKQEERDFYYLKEHPDGSSLLKASDISLDRYEVRKVKCVTIADVFSDNSLAYCDVLKVDAEYAENFIFIPEFSSIISKVGYVCLEWHCYNRYALAQMLDSVGFNTGITEKECSGGGILTAKNLNYKKV